jgi:hypothetical protein
MKLQKILIGVFFLTLGLSFSTFSQSDDEGVKACVNNYLDGILRGDTARLNRAFHPTAMLRTINSASGQMQDLPVRRFIAGTPAGGIQTKGGSTKMLSYSYIGVSALATVELQFADFKYIDLLSMLKFGNEWRIVSRVFSRAELGQSLQGQGMSSGTTSAQSTPTAKAPAKKSSSANPKPKADDGW